MLNLCLFSGIRSFLSIQTKVLKAQAQILGFDQLGITTAEPPKTYGRYLEWIEKGYAADMWYLTESSRMKRRGDLTTTLEGVESVLVGAFSYAPAQTPQENTPKIARYAWGTDYHDVVKAKLHKLADWMKSATSEAFNFKAYVDTGPILERDLAERAGIGWIGKNTCTISGKAGSYHVLGVLLTTLKLPPDSPATNHCGTCTRCLEACPTQAFPEPYQLDANRCISYHTLENRTGEIPSGIAKHLEGWVAGCDICQEVCPWNRKPQISSLNEFSPRPHTRLSVDEGRNLDSERFSKMFKNTALERTGWKAFSRNLLAAFPTYPVALKQERGMIPPKMNKLLHDYLIRQVPLSPGIVVSEEKPLREVVDAMNEYKAGCVVTMRGHEVSGIFTERDVVDRVILENVDWDNPISMFSTIQPETMLYSEPLRKALYIMRKKDFRHLPVFKEDGTLRGVLSLKNVIKLLAEHFPEDVMNLPPKLHATHRTPEGG